MAKQISRFKQSLSFINININNVNLNDGSVLLRTIKSVRESTIQFIKYSRSISSKYKISKLQTTLCCLLESLLEILEESRLINSLENFIFAKSQNMMDLSNSHRHFSRLVTTLDIIEENIDSYLMKKGWISKINHFLFNDSFASCHKFKMEIFNRYNYEEISVKTNDNNNLDALLLKPKAKHTVVNDSVKPMNLIIMCGPNGTPYEYFTYTWLDFYLDNGTYLLLWNYRGYGDSTGTPSYSNIKEDAESIYKYLSKLYTWDKIGTHGISLGGIPTCHLAAKNLVSTCFADRTFSCIENIIQGYPLGPIAVFLYKLLLFKSSNNVENFIKSKAAKLLSCDPSDNIVNDSASLKTGIAKHILRLKTQNDEENYSFNKDLLSSTFSKFELNDNIQSIVKLVKDIYKYSVLKKNKVQESFMYDKLNEDSQDEYKILSKLRSFLELLDSAGETLLNLDKISKYNERDYLNNFFSNLLIWGSYKSTRLVKNRLSAYILASKKLNLMIKKIRKILNNKEKYILKEDQTLSLSKVLEFFSKIETTFNKAVFKKNSDSEIVEQSNLKFSYELNSINENSNEEFSSFMKNLTIGNIIPIKCGHNGMFNREELDIYRAFLMSSKIFNV